jgi:hypothetical protein
LLADDRGVRHDIGSIDRHFPRLAGHRTRPVESLIKTHLKHFSFKDINDGATEVRDFQTTGVVAFAKGCPISKLQAGKQDIGGHCVQVKEDYRQNCEDAIDELVAKL